MSEIEFNKIFAAILIAGITFMLSGFIADKVFYKKKLETPAFPIAGVELDPNAAVEKKEELPEPVLELIASADVALGEKISRQCAACHSFDQGGPQKIGPNLWNVMNRPKGAVGDFAYSNALVETGGAWGYESMNKFLWRPDWYVKGTKMNYIGLKKPEQRAAMIAWLRTLSNSEFPLPTQPEIDAEKAELLPPPAEQTTQDASDSDEAIDPSVSEDDQKQGFLKPQQNQDNKDT